MIIAQAVIDLRDALAICGYDLAEIMGNRTRRREYTDMRAIVWTIFCDQTKANISQAGRAFGWDRGTIYHSIVKARNLIHRDRFFADEYDSILGAYVDLVARRESETKSQ